MSQLGFQSSAFSSPSLTAKGTLARPSVIATTQTFPTGRLPCTHKSNQPEGCLKTWTNMDMLACSVAAWPTSELFIALVPIITACPQASVVLIASSLSYLLYLFQRVFVVISTLISTFECTIPYTVHLVTKLNPEGRKFTQSA